MKRMIVVGLIALVLIASCDDGSRIIPTEPTVIGSVVPSISGNEIVFAGVRSFPNAGRAIDDVRLNYTAFTTCDPNQWIYNYATRAWDRFTMRFITCGDALTPKSHQVGGMGFPVSVYVSPQGEMKLRYGTDEKLDEAHVPTDYMLEVLAY